MSPSHLLGFSPSLRPLSLLTVICCPLDTQQCPVSAHRQSPGHPWSCQLCLPKSILLLAATTTTGSTAVASLRDDRDSPQLACPPSSLSFYDPPPLLQQPEGTFHINAPADGSPHIVMRSAFLRMGAGSSAVSPTSCRRRPAMHTLGLDPETHRLAPALVRLLLLPFPPQSPASTNSS